MLEQLSKVLIDWFRVPLLACPAVFSEQAVLDKPAGAPGDYPRFMVAAGLRAGESYLGPAETPALPRFLEIHRRMH